jgi:acyl-coenzyme A synthetase/AMP-(fatty) acid ligase
VPKPFELDFSDAELERSIVERFAKVLRHLPKGHIAYQDENETISYSELDVWSNSIANSLSGSKQSLMLDTRKPVAICASHGAESIAGVLGVLKTGRFYVLMDPELGESHNKRIISDSTPAALITTRGLLETEILKNVSKLEIPVFFLDDFRYRQNTPLDIDRIAPDHWTSIQYTSGSTGKPQGIVQTHRRNLYTSFQNYMDLCINPTDRIAHNTSFAFAFSNISLWGGLLNGATIHGFHAASESPRSLLDKLRIRKITILPVPVGVLRGLLRLPTDVRRLEELRAIITGGEVITRTEIENIFRFLRPQGKIMIQLASTEAGTYTRSILDSETAWNGNNTAAGKIAPLRDVTVLDEAANPVPLDTPGELVIKDRYIAFGYWKNDDLTSARFSQDGSGKQRKFFTGDIVKKNSDGLIEFVGRRDTMVKIRGYRIQLESVESALESLPEISRAAAKAQSRNNGNKQLVAFVILATGSDINMEEIRTNLRLRLPHYMVPTRIAELESFPETTNGKINRNELPRLLRRRPVISTPFEPPRSRFQIQLCRTWAEELEIDEVGIYDDFFQLGGDSLLAASTLVRMETLIGKSIPISFFEQATISRLEELVSGRGWSRQDSNEKAISLHAVRSRNAIHFVGVAFRRLPKLFRKVFGLVFTILIRHSVDLLTLLIDFRQGIALIRWWSGLRVVQATLYARESFLFYRTATDIGVSVSSDEFQRFLEGNLLLRMPLRPRSAGFYEKRRFKIPKLRFWKSFESFVETKSLEILNRQFCVSGLDIVADAFTQGRGVIMLGYHSTAVWAAMRLLRRWLGCSPIITISAVAVLRGLKERKGSGDRWHETKGKGRLAALVHKSIEILKKGEIIQILPDTNFRDDSGMQLSWAGRQREIKPGFASIALDTGAIVIPHFTTILNDGRFHTTFCTPIDPGSARSDRGHRIQYMIHQYEQFMDHCWHTALESVSFVSLRHHMRCARINKID